MVASARREVPGFDPRRHALERTYCYRIGTDASARGPFRRRWEWAVRGPLERELLRRLDGPPDIVICDSQVVQKVVADTPESVRCTTFSILFARRKGDLQRLAEGAGLLRRLPPVARPFWETPARVRSLVHHWPHTQANATA